MKQLLQLEELAMTFLGMAGLYFQSLHFSWWLWVVLFFAPDLSMLGYAVNTRAGAIIYNLFHHKATAILIATAGFCAPNSALLLTGLLLFAHTSFDRILGYGLKYKDDFKHTHLGWLKDAK